MKALITLLLPCLLFAACKKEEDKRSVEYVVIGSGIHNISYLDENGVMQERESQGTFIQTAQFEKGAPLFISCSQQALTMIKVNGGVWEEDTNPPIYIVSSVP